MGECARCHVDGYRENEVRIYFSGCCDCRLCSRCLQLAKAGACPGCGIRARVEDFSTDPRESREVDKEMKVRRQIKQIYCKKEQDFATPDEWDEYLMMREDIIYKLAHSSLKDEVQETWRQVERYKAQHALDIRQVQKQQPHKILEKMAAVITAEGTCKGAAGSFYDRHAIQVLLHEPRPVRTMGESIRTPQLTTAATKDVGHFQETFSHGRVAFGHQTLQKRDFAGRVNADWAAAAQFHHPLQDQYNDLLKELPESPVGARTSPMAPQPLLAGSAPATGAVQSGGGQEPDIGLQKARYFFLADLSSLASDFSVAAKLQKRS